jgi:DUF917 family protein
MYNTLDSVNHAIECLENKLNVKNIVKRSFIGDLVDLETKYDNTFYFGVLTIGNNIETAKLDFLNNQFINVEKNSQIIALFDKIFIDQEIIDNKVPYPEGHFRGFILTAPASSYVYEDRQAFR